MKSIGRAGVLSLAVFFAACADEPPALDSTPIGGRPAAAASGRSAPAATERATATPAPAVPAADGPRVRVETVTVAAEPLAETIELSGELRADESVELRSRVSGHVAELSFAEGQRVRRGALLVKIDDDDLQAERARIAVQRDFAAKREQRAKALFDEATISKALYEESAGDLAVLEAQLNEMDAGLAQTEIRAPFDGTIGLRSVSVGSYLTPAVAIASLHAIDPIKIDLAAPERYAQRIRAGHQLSFEVAGLDQRFDGTVYAVEPRIDAATRTLRIRARAANPTGRLLPGAFVRAHLVLSTGQAFLVPSIALIPGLDTTTVFVVEDGKAAERNVRTGVRTERMVEIIEGLAAGDRVIVSGIQQVEPGTAVDAGP